MPVRPGSSRLAMVIIAMAFLTASAGAAENPAKLTWIAGSTVRVEQLIGDCDYPAQAQTGTCAPTTSQTNIRSRVVGTDLGASFESQGKVIFLFGDTIGPDENYLASDTIATSTSTDPDAGLFLEFLTNSDGSPFFVRIPGVRMGAGEVPNAGIRLGETTYVVVNTGADRTLPDPNVNNYSVLTRFDEEARTFTPLRTLSARPGGRFIFTSLQRFGDDVLIFGSGAYRADNVYLARVPVASFESGTGTSYFAGMANGQPIWSSVEADSVPVVVDNPLDVPGTSPAIGNASVTFCEELDLWLMTYDGGSQTPATTGIHFTYAAEPWGPWSKPQLVFNPRREGALGTFIHDPSIVPNPPGDGLNGPTIGANDPYTTRGGGYAPYMIDRFTTVAGDKLSIHYLLSTWNPYTVVRMRSDFEIGVASSRRRSVRH
jgi:hypothetical protein